MHYFQWIQTSANMKYMLLFLLSLICVCLPSTTAACPDEDAELTLWSDSSTWSNAGLPVPSGNTDVVIKDGMEVKLDVDLDVRSITIETNGRLVWDSGRDSFVRTHYIYIRGTMEIGSEDCQFQKNAEIILKGIRNEVDPAIPKCGQKFVCVDAGGTVELHGQDKMSWTKLSNTLNPLKLGDGINYKHQETNNVKHDWREGLRVYEFDSSLRVVRHNVFSLSGQNQEMTILGIEDFGRFFESISDNNVVGIALIRNLKSGNEVDLSDVYNKIESLGATKIRDVEKGDAYALVSIKGDASSAVEVIDKYSKPVMKAIASKDFLSTNKKLVVTSQVTPSSWRDNMVDFVVYDWDRAYPVIDVVSNTATWLPGDRVLITSTDFNMEQAEVVEIINCGTSCNNNQIRIDSVPLYQHWAKLKNNVDMRAEVALLTRKIKIRGQTESSCPTPNGNCNDYAYDTFGGHVKFLRNFKNVHIEGVQLDNMGQATQLGTYPLHFHMCHDTDGVEYPDPPYLRKNSIYYSFARCITIHGSHGVTVQDNVCVDTLGHSIFLEDGGEKRTVIDGNLVALTRKGKLIPSDEQPASYWITNPLTTIRNNVAAGSVHMGFWIIYPDKPTGPSANLGFMAENEAKHTKITELSNNLGHSNLRACLFIDGIINHDLTAGGANNYRSRTMPTDPDNPDAKDDPVYITKQTCFKNNIINTWVRGGPFIISKYSSADSSNGLVFARRLVIQMVSESVVMGETDNIGQPTTVYNKQLKRDLSYPRSLVLPWDDKTPIQGITYYDGPIHLENIWFSDFKPTENYTSGAIGFLRNNEFFSSSASSAENIKFDFTDPSGGNRVFDGDETVHGFSNLDGDKAATFRDIDDTVSGLTGMQQIVKPGPYYTTHECLFRTNWKMAICPYKYTKLDVVIGRSAPERGLTSPIMVRDDRPDNPEVLPGKHTPQFMAILGGSYSYTLHWTNDIPMNFSIEAKGVELGQHVRVGMCMPPQADFNLYSTSPNNRPTRSDWTEVSSINDLDSDTVGDRYFYDRSANMLFVKFLSHKTRSDKLRNCEGECPFLVVTMLSGDRTNGNCQFAAYRTPGNYRKQDMGPVVVDTRTLGATSSSPPSNWGAGSQLPFQSRQIINGGWTAWSEYDSCPVTCGGGTQSRLRYCTNPVPSNVGADCVGESSQTIQCNTDLCESEMVYRFAAVDGGLTEWSLWSNCITPSGCQGYRERERSCTNPSPANGGRYCAGAIKAMKRCTCTQI